MLPALRVEHPPASHAPVSDSDAQLNRVADPHRRPLDQTDYGQVGPELVPPRSKRQRWAAVPAVIDLSTPLAAN